MCLAILKSLTRLEFRQLQYTRTFEEDDSDVDCMHACSTRTLRKHSGTCMYSFEFVHQQIVNFGHEP